MSHFPLWTKPTTWSSVKKLGLKGYSPEILTMKLLRTASGLDSSFEEGRINGLRGGGGGGGTGWNRWNDNKDKSKLVCLYCKKKKHTKESCFELIVYPDWWIEKHGKPPNAPPPACVAPWNRGGHTGGITRRDLPKSEEIYS